MGSNCCKTKRKTLRLDAIGKSVDNIQGGADSVATEGTENVPIRKPSGLDVFEKWDLLLSSIMKDDHGTCETILKTGVDVNEPFKFKMGGSDCDGNITQSRTMNSAPLHLACIYRRPNIIRTLLKHEAKPDLLDNFGRPPVGLVIQYWPRIYFPHFDLINVAKAGHSEDKQYKDYIRCQHERSVECLELLLNHDVDANTIVNSRCQTSLHLCAKYNLKRAAEILIGRGAEVNHRDADSQTPLGLSASYSNTDLVETLIENGGDVNDKDRDGRNPFHHACENDVIPVATIERLLLSGTNINELDNTNNTPLHLAVLGGQSEKAKYLLVCGANADLKNDDGCNPLYLLMDVMDQDIPVTTLDYLIPATTDIHIRNKAGNLPRILKYKKEPFVKFRQELELSCQTPAPLTKFCMKVLREKYFLSRAVQKELIAIPGLPRYVKQQLWLQLHDPVADILRAYGIKYLFQSDESDSSTESSFSL